MRWHTHDNLADPDAPPAPRGRLVDRSWWLTVPRLLLACRVLGHRPTVDGVDTPRWSARWVVCSRCGTRPSPQGDLDPTVWAIRQPYDGPFVIVDPLPKDRHARLAELGGPHPPGAWPRRPVGEVSGEVVLGRTYGRISFGIEVGCEGDEHTFGAAVTINPIGALYVTLAGFGRGLARRLNPGTTTKTIGLDLYGGRLSWQVWADRDYWSSETPAWRSGSVGVNPLDSLLGGPKRYDYRDEAGPDLETVDLTDGTYQLQLVLRRQRYGRPRGKARYSWSVAWRSDRPIPVRPDDAGSSNGIVSAAVEVGDQAVTDDTWAAEALTRIAAQIETMRARHRYRPQNAGEQAGP
ncbi:hypothetical protein GCM10010466_39780 [Planomonospora alba]|uniref:Uncharacterized protein n=1 Tax=Planomonospora alba TaxID=161354 RepID=A0ABP6NFT0_9ACTN